MREIRVTTSRNFEDHVNFQDLPGTEELEKNHGLFDDFQGTVITLYRRHGTECRAMRMSLHRCNNMSQQETLGTLSSTPLSCH